MNGKPIVVPKAPTFKPKDTFCVPEDILFYAFRYALGRRTYAVADVASEIRAHASTLSAKTRALIVKEIRAADQDTNVAGQVMNGLGDTPDQEEWRRTLNILEGGKPLDLE